MIKFDNIEIGKYCLFKDDNEYKCLRINYVPENLRKYGIRVYDNEHKFWIDKNMIIDIGSKEEMIKKYPEFMI